MTIPTAAQVDDEPPIWRLRCGMPKLDQYPTRCVRALAHDEGHRGMCGEVWPGRGSTVPLCYRSTYRCWCRHNRPGGV